MSLVAKAELAYVRLMLPRTPARPTEHLCQPNMMLWYIVHNIILQSLQSSNTYYITLGSDRHRELFEAAARQVERREVESRARAWEREDGVVLH